MAEEVKEEATEVKENAEAKTAKTAKAKKIKIDKAEQYQAIKIETREDLLNANKTYSFGGFKKSFINYIKENKPELASDVDEIFVIKTRPPKKKKVVVVEEVKEPTFEELKNMFLALCKNTSEQQKVDIAKNYDEAIKFAIEAEELAMIEKEEEALKEKQKELAERKKALIKK